MIPLTAVHAYIVRDGRVLLGRRLKRDPNRGKWATFGGIANEGETPREALRRELREELGIEVSDPRFFDTVEDEAGREVMFFIVRDWDGQPENLREHSEIGWFEYSQTTGIPMVGYVRDVLRRFLDGEGAGGPSAGEGRDGSHSGLREGGQ